MRTLALQAAAVVAACASAGCIEDPSTTNPISITAMAPSAVANGAAIVTLHVSAATDGDVILTASTGTFVNAPAPAAGAPATLTAKTARGSTDVTYRAGLDTGDAVITASSGAFTSSTSIALTASLPAQIILTPSRTSVTGDGVSFVELQTEAIAAGGAAVSHRTALHYGVCCMSGSSVAECAVGVTPLAVPSIARVSDGEQVVVRAVAAHAAAAISGVVVARLDNAAITGSLCAGKVQDEVRSNQVAISINP
jgi:hypothetical protein